MGKNYTTWKFSWSNKKRFSKITNPNFYLNLKQFVIISCNHTTYSSSTTMTFKKNGHHFISVRSIQVSSSLWWTQSKTLYLTSKSTLKERILKKKEEWFTFQFSEFTLWLMWVFQENLDTIMILQKMNLRKVSKNLRLKLLR